MGRFCCVVKCGNRSERDRRDKRFFNIPKIITHHNDAKTESLSEKRRNAWIASINRKNWTPTKYTCVCSDHFISGNPAKLYDQYNPDWVPTLKMGVEGNDIQQVAKNSSSVRKYERRKVRDSEKNKLVISKVESCNESSYRSLPPMIGDPPLNDTPIQMEITSTKEQCTFNNLHKKELNGSTYGCNSFMVTASNEFMILDDLFSVIRSILDKTASISWSMDKKLVEFIICTPANSAVLNLKYKRTILEDNTFHDSIPNISVTKQRLKTKRKKPEIENSVESSANKCPTKLISSEVNREEDNTQYNPVISAKDEAHCEDGFADKFSAMVNNNIITRKHAAQNGSKKRSRKKKEKSRSPRNPRYVCLNPSPSMQRQQQQQQTYFTCKGVVHAASLIPVTRVRKSCDITCNKVKVVESICEIARESIRKSRSIPDNPRTQLFHCMLCKGAFLHKDQRDRHENICAKKDAYSIFTLLQSFKKLK